MAAIGTWVIFGATALLLVVFWVKNKQLDHSYWMRLQNAAEQYDDLHRNRVDILAWLLNVTSVNRTDFS